MKNALTLTFILAGSCWLSAQEKKAPAPSSPTTHANVSYGPHKANVLDIWIAEGDGPHPLHVYIHGGGWVRGTKESNVLRVLPYLEMGWAVVNVG